MRTKRFTEPRHYECYRPEFGDCPHCSAALIRKGKAWKKSIVTFAGIESVYCYNYICRNKDCPFPEATYRSAYAESLSLKGFSFGMDILTEIGIRRMERHETVTTIHQALKDRGVAISLRSIQYLWEAYLHLVSASLPDQVNLIRPVLEKNGGMVLSIDGIQPEKGHDTLYVTREVTTGQVLGAALLESSKTDCLIAFLAPLHDLGLPILGVISDKQESLCLAVERAFPEVPHQYCHFHFFKELAKPLVEKDRTLKTNLKKKIRGIRAIEDALKTVPENQRAKEWEALHSYTVVLRSALLERGIPPFDLPGMNVYEALSAIATSIERCLQKKLPHS